MAIKTILCIEDDRFIGEMYIRSLQHAGYSVEWMVDGNEGLTAAREKTYDLIILDIMLPEKRGDQILRSLRNESADFVPNSKILIMTNFEHDDQTRESMLKHVDGYLIKADITPRKLLEVIGQLGADTNALTPSA